MTQFYSRIDTEFNGDVYNIPFSYSKESEISVYLDDELFTGWYFLNESQIKFTELPSKTPEIVTIRRTTDITKKVVEYTNNTMLSKEALNLSQDQLLNAIQEIYDNNIVFELDSTNQIATNKADTDAQIEANKQDTDNQIATFEADINATIEEVTEAAAKINELEDAVTMATTSAENAEQAANLATQEAAKAIDKANELTESLALLDATASGLEQEILNREENDNEIRATFEAVDSILQAQIDELRFISKKVYCEYLNFLKAGSTHTQLQIRPNTVIQFTLGGIDYWFKTLETISFDAVAKLDEGTALSAATDYSVYITPIDDGFDFVVSKNSTYPKGFTADTAYKIGGFHTLCVAVTSANAPAIPSNTFLSSTTHPAIGYNAGEIIPNSIWCLTHRPTSNPSGMVYVNLLDKWVDIYLQSGTLKATASVYGASTTDSRQPILHQLDMVCVGKKMPTDHDFFVFAEGSNQKTAIKGAADAVTTGGHVDTASKRMISAYFVEDCCGFLWQWLDEVSPHGGSGFNNYGSNAEERGASYGMPYVLLAGGLWSSSSSCGSWSRVCHHPRSDVSASLGCRGVSRSLLIGKVA